MFSVIRNKSKEIGIDLLFGFIEKDGDKIYSSCALIENGALSHLYRRISKGWKEYSITDWHYDEGTAVRCFNYRGKKCLIALCGDLWDFHTFLINSVCDGDSHGGCFEFADGKTVSSVSMCSENILTVEI